VAGHEICKFELLKNRGVGDGEALASRAQVNISLICLGYIELKFYYLRS
jgi:hypothetical protein